MHQLQATCFCVFLNTKAAALIARFLLNACVHSWQEASRAEKESSLEQKEATWYNWILPCVGWCLWCQDIAFWPRPLTPPSLESFLKWCLHHKMSTRTQTRVTWSFTTWLELFFFLLLLCGYPKWMSRNLTIVFKVDSLHVSKIGQWCRMCTIVQILFSGFKLLMSFYSFFWHSKVFFPPFFFLTTRWRFSLWIEFAVLNIAGFVHNHKKRELFFFIG